jgi:hypothetical protein
MQEAIHQNSSHFEPIPGANLTPAQFQVISALASGQTVTASAEQAGVHRTTVHHWLRTQPDFKAAVDAALADCAAELNDGMRDLVVRALHTLHELLQDRATPQAVRLKTALAVLQRPPAGWQVSPAIDDPQPEAAPAAPVARTAPCPCGSGRKYKRCCALALASPLLKKSAGSSMFTKAGLDRLQLDPAQRDSSA